MTEFDVMKASSVFYAYRSHMQNTQRHTQVDSHRRQAQVKSSATSLGPDDICVGELREAEEERALPSPRLCYLSERVRGGRGGAVGGAKAKRKLPLVNKKSARRFRLWLQNTRWRKKNQRK